MDKKYYVVSFRDDRIGTGTLGITDEVKKTEDGYQGKLGSGEWVDVYDVVTMSDLVESVGYSLKKENEHPQYLPMMKRTGL